MFIHTYYAFRKSLITFLSRGASIINVSVIFKIWNLFSLIVYIFIGFKVEICRINVYRLIQLTYICVNRSFHICQCGVNIPKNI